MDEQQQYQANLEVLLPLELSNWERESFETDCLWMLMNSCACAVGTPTTKLE